MQPGMMPAVYRGHKLEVSNIWSSHEAERKFHVQFEDGQQLLLDLDEGVVGIVPRPAGSSYNVAYGLTRLGVSSAIMGAVGNDYFGNLLVNSLLQEHITLLAIPRGAGTPMTLSAIEMPPNASTTLFNCKPAYDLPINQALLLLDGIVHRFAVATGVRVSELELVTRIFMLQKDNFLVPNETLCHRADDPNVKVLFKLTNILQANYEEAQALSGCANGDLEEMATNILAMGPDKVIITRDVQGVFVGRSSRSRGSKYLEEKAAHAQVKDTDGAGDAFTVGFIYGLLSGMPIRRCLKIGTWIAARNIEQYGGYGGMPAKQEVYKMFKRFFASK
jgi:sugar/nucleoside kinase (ribokinase family)